MEYAKFIISLGVMILGANIVISGAVELAKRFRVSPLLIGLIVIGFGTSFPELTTSFLSMYDGQTDLAVGNVVGSNIANILLVLGVAAVLRPISIQQTSFKRDALFLGISAIVLLVSLAQPQIDWQLGSLMCMTLFFYVYHAYKTDKKSLQNKVMAVQYVALSKRFYISTPMACLVMGCGLVLTLVGAKVLLQSVLNIFTHWGFSEVVIGLTIVALGTSLPELVTSIIASLRKESDVALGNVMGSNIYNALFILGITSIFKPVSVPGSDWFAVDVCVMLLATALLLGLGLWKKKLTRRMGVGFLVTYLVYLIYLGVR